MYTETTLIKYLESISAEIASSVEKIVPLYKYGYILKKEHLKELKVHRGYRGTIERYIKDKKSVTRKELMCILSLYSLEYPEYTPVVPVQLDELLFVPVPSIGIDPNDVVQVVNLTFAPVPSIELLIGNIPINITFVPVPQISIEQMNFLTYTPVPQISTQFEGLGTIIEFTPIPQIYLHPDTVISKDAEVLFIPVPTIEGLSYIAPELTFIPTSQITLVPEIPSGDMIYWGVIERISSDPRPLIADFGFLDSGIARMTLDENVPTNILLSFDHTKYGYMVFAYPDSAPIRKTYIDPNGLNGYIGGVANPMGNLWPDAEIKFNDIMGIPKNYKVYITSFWTRPIKGQYVLRDSEFITHI